MSHKPTFRARPEEIRRRFLVPAVSRRRRSRAWRVRRRRPPRNSFSRSQGCGRHFPKQPHQPLPCLERCPKTGSCCSTDARRTGFWDKSGSGSSKSSNPVSCCCLSGLKSRLPTVGSSGRWRRWAKGRLSLKMAEAQKPRKAGWNFQATWRKYRFSTGAGRRRVLSIGCKLSRSSLCIDRLLGCWRRSSQEVLKRCRISTICRRLKTELLACLQTCYCSTSQTGFPWHGHHRLLLDHETAN